ncbi:MAG: aminoglycoside phosphotransferase family protein [Propionibacteriaceae bacterium]|nr:aminoglycoside phosphotransferase family protein [Propionibacteriaceae bacterium]
MESITKYRQTPETLRRLIERAYGPGAVPDGDDFAVELGEGWFNVGYIVRLRDGRESVLKIAPPPGVEVMTYEHNAMRSEIDAIRLISTHTDVPVPPVDLYDDSHQIIDADWFAMPRIPGENLHALEGVLGEEAVLEGWRQIGAATRRLNQIPGPGFGRYGAELYPTWRAAFEAICEDVLADGERRSVDIGHDYAAIRTLIASNIACLDAVTDPVFCEWDLWQANAMVHDGRLVAVVDHERAFWGDPLMEAGFLEAAQPGHAPGVAFLEGYGRGPLTDAEMARRRLYTLHLFLIMTIETAYRGHTTPDQYQFVRGQLDQAVSALGRGHA